MINIVSSPIHLPNFFFPKVSKFGFYTVPIKALEIVTKICQLKQYKSTTKWITNNDINNISVFHYSIQSVPGYIDILNSLFLSIDLNFYKESLAFVSSFHPPPAFDGSWAVDVNPRILEAASISNHWPSDPEFIRMMDEMKARYSMFQTKKRALTNVGFSTRFSGNGRCLLVWGNQADKVGCLPKWVFGGRMKEKTLFAVRDWLGSSSMMNGDKQSIPKLKMLWKQIQTQSWCICARWNVNWAY